jgi:hypothetical protein
MKKFLESIKKWTVSTVEKFIKFVKKWAKWALLIVAPIPLAAIVLIIGLATGTSYSWLQGIVTLGIAWIPSFLIFFIMTKVHAKRKQAKPEQVDNAPKAETK